MSKATGIKGMTPDRLRRNEDAVMRQLKRNDRTVAEQTALLDERPGASAKEREKLERWS